MHIAFKVHVPPQGQVVRQKPKKQHELEHDEHELEDPSTPSGQPALPPPEQELPFTLEGQVTILSWTHVPL